MSGKGNNTELKRTIQEIDKEIYNLNNLEAAIGRCLQHFNHRRKKKNK